MIDKGSFIRKKSWGFFKHTWLSDEAEYVPSIQIISIHQNKPETVVICGESYSIDSLVEITEIESMLLNREFHVMKLSEVEVDDISQHIRKDNGEVKVSQEYGYSLRYCFTFNHKNPGVTMNAYKCKICGNIHCGVSVVNSAITNPLICKNGCTYSKAWNQIHPRLCIHCGIPEQIGSIMIEDVPKPVCRHQYSKAMGQPYPRLCAMCKEPEPIKVL